MAINYMRGTTAYSEVSSRDKYNWDRKNWSLIQYMREDAIAYARENNASEYVILTAEKNILERERMPPLPEDPAPIQSEAKPERDEASSS